MRLSIITPWRNHPELIPDYERAVRGAGQVIIFDNASDWETASQLQDMVERLDGLYLRSEENLCFAPANNAALELATGDGVIFLNNDVWATGNWLYCAQYDLTDRTISGPRIAYQTLAGKTLSYVEGWCVGALRETWEILGGWDAEAFPLPYWEDVDLSQRAIQRGYSLRQCLWPIQHKGRVTAATEPHADEAQAANALVVELRHVRGRN